MNPQSSSPPPCAAFVFDVCSMLMMTIVMARTLFKTITQLPNSERKRLNRALVKAYHVPDSLVNAHRAMDEVILRITYELLIRKIHLHDLGSAAWFTTTKRDVGHARRIRNLLLCIMHDDTVHHDALACKWLDFKSAFAHI